MAFAEQSEFMVNFVGGLNTEASSLNFPENAAQDIDNFDLFITGEVKRRLGLDFETSYTVRPETTTATNTAAYAISKSEWHAVNGKGDLNFLVVQIGTTLYFHDLGAEPISATLRGSVDLSSSKVGDSPEDKVLTFAYGEGVLIVGNQDLDPTIIEYDDDTQAFSKSPVTIQIRDFAGIEESVAADSRLSSITNDHRYNLRNQGWPTSIRSANDADGDDGVTNTDPINWTKTKIGVYPSNADIVHAAKMTAADDARSIGTFSPWDLQKLTLGNTPAPKGHYILDAFAADRKAASGITVTDNGYNTGARPSAVGFYAGRAWYAGVPDRNYVGNIYFSQSLTDLANAGKCYQEYDPTAEDLNALLATDGGVIHIADLGRVYRLIEVGTDLIVVASNGIWAISGVETKGTFTADSFSVRKITREGCSSKESIIETEGQLWWWGEGGIWRMQSNSVDPTAQAVDRVTLSTIQTFYDEQIGNAAKAYARGFYDPYAKKVYWLYNDSDTYDGITDRFFYNRVLVMDTTLEAFYTYTISEMDADSPLLAGLTVKTPGSETVTTYDIWDGENDVEYSGDDVVQDVAFESFATVQLKALCFVENEDTTWSYTFGEFNSRDFVDWKTWDVEKNGAGATGVNFTSHIQTGWRNSTDPSRTKTITHLTSFFSRTEDGYQAGEESGVVEFTNPSGAYVQVRWDYTDADTGRWTDQIQAYRLDRWYLPEDEFDPFTYGATTIRSKIRMRGRGEAMSVRYDSEDGKDMNLLGFGLNLRAVRRP